MTLAPEKLWAPHRTVISSPRSAASLTTVCTSASSAHLAIIDGRRSMSAFHTRLLSSYAGSSAPITSPRIRPRSSRSGLSAVWVMAASSGIASGSAPSR